MRRRYLLLGATALLASCATPKVNNYQLATVPGATHGGDGRKISVRSIGVPGAIAQSGLPEPGGAYDANAYANDVWSAPIAGLLQAAMVQDLAQRLPGDVVLADGGAIGAAPDIYVEINILAFSPDKSGNITLTAQLAARHASAQDWTMRNFTASAQNATAPETIAAAMSMLWGQAADAVAGMLAAV